MAGSSVSIDRLADSIVTLIYRVLGREDAPVAKVQMAIWKAANSTDSNLSQVRLLNGTQLDYIPKLSGLSFSANDPILVLYGPGVPYTIIGKVVGDITLPTTL